MTNESFIAEVATRCRGARTREDLEKIKQRIAEAGEGDNAKFILVAIEDLLTGSLLRLRLSVEYHKVVDDLMNTWRANGVKERSNEQA